MARKEHFNAVRARGPQSLWRGVFDHGRSDCSHEIFVIAKPCSRRGSQIGYPGFDTTSSIALLAISALAKKGADRTFIPAADFVLPVMLSANILDTFSCCSTDRLSYYSQQEMTVIDAADSILMLHSYTGFPDKSWAVFERLTAQQMIPTDLTRCPLNETIDISFFTCVPPSTVSAKRTLQSEVAVTHLGSLLKSTSNAIDRASQNVNGVVTIEEVSRDLRVKQNMISGQSIVFTLMSILVAF
jgi:high-affinity nickel-transport protein